MDAGDIVLSMSLLFGWLEFIKELKFGGVYYDNRNGGQFNN